MRLKRLIKDFEFDESVRGRITLGANTRLNPQTGHLQLLADPITGLYPTTANLAVRTWVTNPASLKQWLLFQAKVIDGKDKDGFVVTTVKYRLSDGVNEFWWNGSAWVVNTVNWNTEAEVSLHAPAFPVTSRKLKVVINLATTDPTKTPEVDALRFIFSSDVEFQDDLIYRSLVPALRNVHPISEHLITLPTGPAVTTISLADASVFSMQTPYNIVGIDAVFNHTDDPLHLVDKFVSFDVNTRIITVTSIPATKQVWIRFLFEPQVSVLAPSQDYSEVAKVPSLNVQNVTIVDMNEIGARDGVVDRATNAVVRIDHPFQGDLEFFIELVTDKGADHQRLADEMKRFFANNQFLTSKALDETYRLWLLDEYVSTTAPNKADLHSSRIRARIVNALFFVRDAVDAFGVETPHLTMTATSEQG